MSSVLKAHPQLAAKAHPPGALWEHLSLLGYELVLKRTALSIRGCPLRTLGVRFVHSAPKAPPLLKKCFFQIKGVEMALSYRKK